MSSQFTRPLPQGKPDKYTHYGSVGIEAVIVPFALVVMLLIYLFV